MMLRRGWMCLVVLALATPLCAQARFDARAPIAIASDAFQTKLTQDAGGNVRIVWTTPRAAGNLGFNIYRQTSSGRVKVNQHLIPGSAFFAARRQLDFNPSYAWKDTVGGSEFVQYTIEDLHLNGVRTLHGPFTPLVVGSVNADATLNARAEAISTDSSGGGIFVSPRGIGAPRYPTLTPTSKQRTQQWDLAAQATARLTVTEEGWYRVAKSQLVAAGFTPGSKLALFTGGVEQPMMVTDDAIEFYGIGLDAPGSDARAYWLSNEKGLGLRIAKTKARGGRLSAQRTPLTFERIERTVFFAALTNNGDRENFFGAVVTTYPVAQEMTVENLDRGGNAATLELVLQGGSEGEHAVRLDFNGTDAGTVAFSGMQRKIAKVIVPLAALVDGDNTLTLTATNGDFDVSVVESLRLTYPHRLVADDNALKVAIAGGTTAVVSGFTASRVRAFDITDPAQPLEVGADFANGTASLVAPLVGMRSILLFGDSRILAPAAIVATRASTWNDRKNGADLLILTTSAFASVAEPLKARRDREGISTTIVGVESIYDEFGFGEHGPNALREFLVRTRAWTRVPKYILLLGDASIDPRNYLGLGAFDFVPTKLVPTVYLKTASDDWFADFGSNGLPQIAIGRLPARTVAEAETMIRHIVERDAAGNDQVAFVTDEDFGYDFDGWAQSLGALVPPSLPQTYAHTASANVFESLVLTYIGHGSVDVWIADGFDGTSASLLTNTKLPIVAGMTCLNGYFHDVYMSSLAEALLTNPNGGAVAVWTSSTLTEPIPQIEMGAEFFRQLFGGATIGESAMRSKAATTDMDVRRSWILFGDPSMHLR